MDRIRANTGSTRWLQFVRTTQFLQYPQLPHEQPRLSHAPSASTRSPSPYPREYAHKSVLTSRGVITVVLKWWASPAPNSKLLSAQTEVRLDVARILEGDCLTEYLSK